MLLSPLVLLLDKGLFVSWELKKSAHVHNKYRVSMNKTLAMKWEEEEEGRDKCPEGMNPFKSYKRAYYHSA